VRNIILSLLILAALLTMDKLYADEHDERTNLNDVSSGSLLFKTDVAGSYAIAPMLETDVEMEINGMILRATVTQKFKNESEHWVEGIYVFPLPENAAVDHLEMRIGDRQIKGIIQEKSIAKQTYRKAKAAGKKAALIEQQRPNIFTSSVANIAPYESITISIEYQQSLHYESINGAGQFSLRFPTTLTPRYIPGQTLPTIEQKIDSIQTNGWALNTDEVPDASQITPPMREDTKLENSFNLLIRLNAGFAVEDIHSPNFNIDVTHLADQQVEISLQDELNSSNRDFTLFWKPSANTDPKAAIFSEQLAGENYHFIMVMPPSSAQQSSQPLAREVIYIIDTSGSMFGESMEQAKMSLQFAIQRLRPSDKFNIIQFDSSTRKMFSSARYADFSNIRYANQYIDGLVADGGTEMLPALMAAMGSTNESDDGSVRQIMFLTDGAVGNETALFSYIQQHLGNNRLFTVGIGSAPNSHFMTKAASFGRGTFTYIGNVNEVQQQLEKLFVKLESPVLHDIQLHWEDGMKVEAWPAKLPDLYLGEPIFVSIKSNSDADAGAGAVMLSGTRSNQEWRVKLPLDKSKVSYGVAAVWANNKIGALTDQMMVSNDKEALQTRITNVALEHHIVSKYTSLVAVDVTPSRPLSDESSTAPMPLNKPAGLIQTRVVRQLSNTATSAPLHFLLGSLLLLLAFFSLRKRSHLVNLKRR